MARFVERGLPEPEPDLGVSLRAIFGRLEERYRN